MTRIGASQELASLAEAAERLSQAAVSAAAGLADQAEREDDVAIAAVVMERKRGLRDEELVDFGEMARRVGVDLDALP